MSSRMSLCVALDQPDARAPTVLIEQWGTAIAAFEFDVVETRVAVRAATGLGAEPFVDGDVVVIATRGQEHGISERAHRIEPERIAPPRPCASV